MKNKTKSLKDLQKLMIKQLKKRGFWPLKEKDVLLRTPRNTMIYHSISKTSLRLQFNAPERAGEFVAEEEPGIIGDGFWIYDVKICRGES